MVPTHKIDFSKKLGDFGSHSAYTQTQIFGRKNGRFQSIFGVRGSEKEGKRIGVPAIHPQPRGNDWSENKVSFFVFLLGQYAGKREQKANFLTKTPSRKHRNDIYI